MHFQAEIDQKGVFTMLKCFKNEKLWCVVGGAVAMVIGKKIVLYKESKEHKKIELPK